MDTLRPDKDHIVRRTQLSDEALTITHLRLMRRRGNPQIEFVIYRLFPKVYLIY